jgi:uncharacterized RDD family membrane protein YckC
MDNINPYAAPTASLLELEEDSPKVEIKQAEFWVRAMALLTDVAVLQFGFTIITVVIVLLLIKLDVATGNNLTLEEILFIVGLLNLLIVIYWLYFTLLESSRWQATIGKRALGIKVTDEQGNRIGFGRANGRYWSKILSALILGIGFLMVMFTQKKQGLHDIIAGTVVGN